jgi:hypothetical protein
VEEPFLQTTYVDSIAPWEGDRFTEVVETDGDV